MERRRPATDSDGQAGALPAEQRELLVDQIEAMIARWEDGEGGTYRDLAERILRLVWR